VILTQLALPYERIEYDTNRGETRTPSFLRINPNGRIPVLELEDGTFLSDQSDLILSRRRDTLLARSSVLGCWRS
jgi:glutathione S-transferase